MTDSVLSWAIAAVLLFWAVGAYNRLMRLRAEANGAFAAVEAELARQVELVRSQLPPPEPTQPAPLEVEPMSFWAHLHAAAGQLAATLAAARHRPLDPEGIDALSAAQEVLGMAWERAARDDAHDLAGPRLPDTMLLRRAQLLLQAHAATEAFNTAVARYNEAIAQFPAMVVAWLFGFRPARALSPVIVPALA
ncbi:LemA family protein [Ramlibacter sp. PS4R-6]|uniref:LemA family protein n=1 Tax=Ramlibacter sp. PS4R-6 TaxID=3133438 RepID=UPI0030A334DA